MSDELTAEQFAFVADFVRDQAAIVLEAGKEYLVETRLRPLARTYCEGSMSDLIQVARQGSNQEVVKAMVDALTTNETHFFRDPGFYEALREFVFPALIDKTRATKTITMWCAASSSGQEPYSVLMMLRDSFPELDNWRIQFIVSDISSEMLERTRSGRYRQLEINRGLPAQLLVKHFDRDGMEWVVKEELRSLLDVREINLAHPWPRLPTVDILFIRNVLIYFDVETKREVLSRARQVLCPDGFLFLGGAETTFNIDDNYQRSPLDLTGCYEIVKETVK